VADIPITISLETLVGDSGAKLAGIVKLLSQLFEQIRDVAKEGDAAKDVFDQISISLDAATRATGGEVTQLELATMANRAHLGGLKLTGEEYGRLAEFAKKAADATGQEFGTVMQTVLQGMITGRTQALRPFIGDLELTGTTAEKQAQIMAALTDKIDDFSQGTDTAGDAAARFETRMADLNTQLKVGFTESTGLIEVFDQLTGAFGEGTRGAHDMGTALGDILAVMIKLNVAFRTFVAMADIVNRFRNQLAVTPRGTGPSQTARNFDASRRAQAEQLGIDLGAGTGTTDVVLPEESIEGDPNAAWMRGGGGGGRARAGASGRAETGTELAESLGAINRERSDEELTGGEGDLGSWLQFQSHEKVYIASLDRIARKDAWFTERTRENAEKRKKARQEEMDFAADMVGTMGGAFGQLAGILGASETAQNLIRGTTETVLAAIAWAKALEPGMQAYIPSAIAHTAAAAAAFAAAANPSGGGGHASAGTGGGVGGGASVGGAFPSSFAGGGGGRTTHITVNMGPGVSSARDIRRAIQEALIMEADNGRPLPYRAVERRR